MVTHGIQISQQGEGMSHTRYLLAVMKALAVLLVSIIIRASISIHLERDLTDDYKGLFFFFFFLRKSPELGLPLMRHRISKLVSLIG